MRTNRNSTKTYARIINKIDDCGHFILQVKYTDCKEKQLGNIQEYTVEDIENFYSYIKILMKPLEEIWDRMTHEI
jgi:hypothetical protein